MVVNSLYYNKGRKVFFLFLLFYALLPCTIKESFFSRFNVVYERPLNKARTTASATQLSSCVNVVLAVSEKKRTAKQIIQRRYSSALYRVNNDAYFWPGKKYNKNYEGFFSGNSPPRYILFKQLKLDLV